MLDIRYIRDNPDGVQENARRKGYTVRIDKLIEIDNSRRTLQQQVDELRERRNQNAATMKGGKPTQAVIDEGKSIKEQLVGIEEKLRGLNDIYLEHLKTVPNMAMSDVPVGASEDNNIVIKSIGDKPQFSFTPKTHYQIAERRGWIDKERAAKVTGARFAYMKGPLVQLQLAIVQFVVATLTDESIIADVAKDAGLSVASVPFEPVLPPLLIRTDMYDAMDRLQPSDDRYKIEGEDLWLQGSAEHVLGSMYAEEVFEEAELPRRLLGYATSFRKEAGTYGKDMGGIMRMHQFDKLEMESFTTSEHGEDEHYFFVAIQEYLLSALGLPYRVIQKCTADIGKPNARGIDIDTWMPGQGTYRETHTADYMTDYQARRLKTRVRRQHQAASDLELVHTNDATAFALGRIMIAIIENGQTENGEVVIPKVLRPFMGNRAIL